MEILAQLGNLRTMNKKARERWALETLSILKNRINGHGQEPFICGFISAGRREGTSTCIKLLAEAARKQGYTPLILNLTRKGNVSNLHLLSSNLSPSNFRPQQALTFPQLTAPYTSTNEEPSTKNQEQPPHLAFSVQPLAFPPTSDLRPLPSDLCSLLPASPLHAPCSSLPAPRSMLTIFLDLPPYSTHEGLVLTEKAPHLVWCSANGKSDLQETQSYMNTLKNSHPHLVGIVFNHAPPASTPSRRKKSRTIHRAAALIAFCLGLGLSLCSTAFAQTDNPIPGVAVADGGKLAPWQERLTLGPGDVIEISLYGSPESSRSGITIGPDGRINYLQARDIIATGQTVDELRATLEKALEKYHLAPKIIINPTAYLSKKYYVLGSVRSKGGFIMDRPVSIIEAIAKSGGFDSAIQYQNVALMVDLPRSFIMRKADDDSFKKLPVDFESLFLRGDLKQNIPLAPGDYLFFPALGPQEIYVLGDVRSPGLMAFTKESTALGAIVSKGGFGEKAWKSRVLIVRGSLSNPEKIILDCGSMIKGKAADIKLQNRDIVYVHRRPWAKAEEILENAVLAFTRAAITGWAGQNVGPFITSPIFK
jgi:protein involved in polysaccharide export with SLBB domain